MSEAVTIAKTQVIDGQYKDINTLVYEINSLYRQTQETMLISAIKLGRKLTQAKELLEHGRWRNWIEENLDFGHDKADIMIKIYENYGSQQESLFGEVNVDTYRHLGVYQAFALLKVPEEERENFVKETHAEDLSVRELKKIIAEREAERDAANAKQEDLKKTNEILAKSNRELKNSLSNAKESDKKLKEAEQELKKARMERAAAEEATKVAQRNLGTVTEKEKKLIAEKEALEKQLAEAKKNPDIPEETLNTLREEAEAKAKEAAEAQIAGANAEAEARIEEAKAEARAELDEMAKKLKASNKEVSIFNGALNGLIASQEVVVSSFRSVQKESPATAEKLILALQALTDAFLKKIKT